MENTPQFPQMVFHRSPRQGHPPVRPQLPHRHRRLAVAVLHVLSFVQHQRVPLPTLQTLHITQRQPITADHHVASTHTLRHRFPIRFPIQHHTQPRSKTLTLPLPVEAERRRSNDQGRPVGRSSHQQGQRLHRLPQTHVVRQHTPNPPRRQPTQPAISLQLIIPQLTPKSSRQLRIQLPRIPQSLQTLLPLPIHAHRHTRRLQLRHHRRRRRIQLQPPTHLQTHIVQTTQHPQNLTLHQSPLTRQNLNQPVHRLIRQPRQHLPQ